MSKDQTKLSVFLIILTALFLRLSGITHGFPFIFHPDEPTIIQSALSVRFFWNPGHFDWPHLYVYLNYFLYMGFDFLRKIAFDFNLRTFISQNLPIFLNDDLVFYYLTRVFSALLGSLTVIPIYLTGKKIFNEKTGLFAALAFAVIPFHVRHSHYSLPDVPMLFMLSWGMYFSSLILLKNDTQNYAGAGTYTGLSASIKYNGALSSVSVFLAHIFRVTKNKEGFLDFSNILSLVIAGLTSVLAFIIGTPYSVLDYKTFLRTDNAKGALWQFTNVGSIKFSDRPVNFINEMLTRLPDDFGYVILAGFFILFFLLTYKLLRRIFSGKDYYSLFFVLSGLTLLFYVSGLEKSRSHYYFIAYPYIAVSFGYLMDIFFVFLERKAGFLSYFVFALIFALPFWFSLKTAYIFSTPDTRNIVYDYLVQNIKPGDTVFYDDDDFQPVAQKFQKKLIEGLEVISPYESGYFVVEGEKNLLVKKDGPFAVSNIDQKVEKVLSVDNNLRNGPVLTVYSINK